MINRSFLGYIDVKLDETIKVFRSNLTMRDVWKSRITGIDRILVLGKFLSHVLHKSLSFVTNILQDGRFRLCLEFTRNFELSTMICLLINFSSLLLSFYRIQGHQFIAHIRFQQRECGFDNLQEITVYFVNGGERPVGYQNRG